MPKDCGLINQILIKGLLHILIMDLLISQMIIDLVGMIPIVNLQFEMVHLQILIPIGMVHFKMEK